MARSHAVMATPFTKSLALALTLGLLAICSQLITGAQAASLQSLGGLSGANAFGSGGVSANGDVVTGELYGAGTQAFRWVGGTLTPLGFLSNDPNSKATAANSDGSVITGYSNGSTDTAFRWAGGTMTSIGALADGTCSSNTALPYSNAFAINANGSTIVGISTSNNYCDGEAFRWTTGGGMQGLGCPIQGPKPLFYRLFR
jgi:probable HAF family extracellular repeat protein